MLLAVCAVLLIAITVYFTLSVREKDLPPPEPAVPGKHFEERKAAIYENLRDLQFEYRVGKLSDADYQMTKVGLQKELAVVLAELEAIKTGVPMEAKEAKVVNPDPLVCPHCQAKFAAPMKFCGECGKEMA
jgi:rRNA maturation endonuclease Nob1